MAWAWPRRALDGVRQRRGEDPKALAAERDHEAKTWAHMATPMVVTPPCAACGTPSARVELVAPGQVPAEWEQWPGTVQASIVRQRQPGQWYLLFKGVATYNGYGDPIDASRAGRIARAFRPPLRFAQVHTAGFYDDAGFCQDCDAPYCYRHWHVTESGYGYCPRGHGHGHPGQVLMCDAVARSCLASRGLEELAIKVPRPLFRELTSLGSLDTPLVRDFARGRCGRADARELVDRSLRPEGGEPWTNERRWDCWRP